jgi:hypothetical protein
MKKFNNTDDKLKEIFKITEEQNKIEEIDIIKQKNKNLTKLFSHKSLEKFKKQKNGGDSRENERISIEIDRNDNLENKNDVNDNKTKKKKGCNIL